MSNPDQSVTDTKCANDKIVTDQITDDEIVAHCTNCGQKAGGKRLHYSKKEWGVMVADAKKHQDGVSNA